MAFYADIYGYIARKEAGGISAEIIDRISQANPIFKPCFSAPVIGRAARYISFACNVKLGEGEDGLWIAPFEMLLKTTTFLNATVNIEHEDLSYMMMYSYVTGSPVQRFVSKMTAQLIEESTVG
ncbi:MAG TPA: hypothetical protein VGG74_19360 [Kofleriaceae bacterium]|jgi:hypothetical protein